jgi:hypothetical protein
VTVIICYKCGIEFHVPDFWQQKRVDDHETFWCPNGHNQAYTGKSKAEKLRDELEQERQRSLSVREQLAVTLREKEKLQKTFDRHKRRSAAGVCPCCNRTVKQLAAHMASKHAEYVQLQGITPRKALPPKKDEAVQ